MTMRMTWFAVGLVLAGLLAGMAATVTGKAGQPRVESFRLPDQAGRPFALAPSRQNTLIYFYRGDW